MNIIYGTSGNDFLYGTAGSDWIYTLTGTDYARAGEGKDVYSGAADGAWKWFWDFQDGSDLIDLRAAGITSYEELTVKVDLPYKSEVTNADGTVKIYVMTINDMTVTVDANDFIYADTPIHVYSSGFDSVNITSNVYSVHLGNGGSNWLNLKSLVRGVDTAKEGALVVMDDDALGNGTFTVKGVTQHFFDFQNVRGTNGQDTIHGDQQDNHIAGLGNADRLYGGGGNDRIFGNRGADRLYGEDGDDIINGGTGRDLLYGGEGEDTFVFVDFDNRRDLVMDFEDGIDLLDISQWGASDIADLAITQLSGGRLLVTTTDGLLGFELRELDRSLQLADLDNSDFIFA